MPDISTPSPEYNADQERRDLPEALYAGEDAMKADADEERRWMRPHPGELRKVKGLTLGGRTATRYDLRVWQSVLASIWFDGVMEATNRPFARPLQLSGWGEFIEKRFRKNVDGANLNLDAFFQATFNQAGVSGMHWVHIDYPRSGTPVPRGVASPQPYWRPVLAKDLIDAVVDYQHGRARLIEARVRVRGESGRVEEEDGKFTYSTSKTDQVWLFRAGDPSAPESSDERKPRVLIFDKDGSGWTHGDAWIPLSDQRGKLSDIPLKPFYVGRDAPFRAQPQFGHAARLMASLWRKQSERDWYASRCAIPLLHRSGVSFDAHGNAKNVSSDPEGQILSEKPEAKVEFVETKGTTLEQLGKEADRLEKAIRQATLQAYLSKPSGTATATEVVQSTFRADTQLGCWVLMNLACLDSALETTALIQGIEASGTTNLPLDLSTLTGSRSENLELYQGGHMTPDGFWKEFQAAGGVSHRLDIDAEIAAAWSIRQLEEVERRLAVFDGLVDAGLDRSQALQLSGLVQQVLEAQPPTGES